VEASLAAQQSLNARNKFLTLIHKERASIFRHTSVNLPGAALFPTQVEARNRFSLEALGRGLKND
jgi:hypothetical protein